MMLMVSVENSFVKIENLMQLLWTYILGPLLWLLCIVGWWWGVKVFFDCDWGCCWRWWTIADDINDTFTRTFEIRYYNQLEIACLPPWAFKRFEGWSCPCLETRYWT